MTILYTLKFFRRSERPPSQARSPGLPPFQRALEQRASEERDIEKQVKDHFAVKASFKKCFCFPCLPRQIQSSKLKFRVWVPVPLGEAVERQELPTGWRTWSLERAGRRTPPPGRRWTTPTSGRRWAAGRRGPIGHILGTPPSQRNLEAPRKGKVTLLILLLKQIIDLYMTCTFLAELI